MAYFYRVPTPAGNLSPFWYVGYDYRDSAGKLHRVQKSTKCNQKKAAERVGLAWEEAARKAVKGRLNLEYVRRVMDELQEDLTGEAPQRYTVKKWVDEWLRNKAPSIAPASRERYQQVGKDFVRFLKARASVDLEQLGKKDVMAFRDAERADKKSPRTCNQTIKILRMIFNDAVKERALGHNPAAAVSRLTEDNTPRTPFTAEEVQKLVQAAPDDEWRGLILLAFYTGGRIGDLSGLHWKNVDLNKGLLEFQPQKTRNQKGQGLVIPLHETAKGFLLSLPSSDDPEGFVFPSLAAQRVGGRSGLSKGFLVIMKTAKVVVETMGKHDGKGRSISRRSFHSLRHSFASLQANAGIAQEVRRKLTGHSSEGVHAIYTHHDLDTLRKAVDVLPDIQVIGRGEEDDSQGK